MTTQNVPSDRWLFGQMEHDGGIAITRGRARAFFMQSARNRRPDPVIQGVFENVEDLGTHEGLFLVDGERAQDTFDRWERIFRASLTDTHGVPVRAALDSMRNEAIEDGHEPPPDEAIADARRIVAVMLRKWPGEYDVYPMDEERVAIEVSGGVGRRMLLLCEPGGHALCIVTVDRVARRARYEDSRMLPDGFVADGMEAMGRSVGGFSSDSRGRLWPNT